MILPVNFRKAFDCIDHTVLVQKFASVGIPGFVPKHTAPFLRDRQQRVKIGNTVSKWSKFKGGVSQGTLLEPTGFLLYIKDHETVCNACKLMMTAQFGSCVHTMGMTVSYR